MNKLIVKLKNKYRNCPKWNCQNEVETR